MKMSLLEKYKKKFARELLKRDVKHLRRIISRYDLTLYMKDTNDLLFGFEGGDNLMHLLREKNYLDGKVSGIVDQLLPAGRVAIDVGANFGLVSSLLSRKFETVFAFEPDAKNIRRMQDLFQKNRLDNIEIVPRAAAEKTGPLRLFIAEATSHHSLGLSHESQNIDSTIEIEAVSLDDFCRDRRIERIDVLKVDVEGFEKEVLLGAKEMLRDKRIKNIIFEISVGVMQRLGRDPYEVPRLLSEYGYSIRSHQGEKLSMTELSQRLLDQDLLASLA